MVKKLIINLIIENAQRIGKSVINAYSKVAKSKFNFLFHLNRFWWWISISRRSK